MTKQQIHIIGGGTSFHIRPHVALSALAYGGTAYDLTDIIKSYPDFEGDIHTYMTRMAGSQHEHLRVENGVIRDMIGTGEESLLRQVMEFDMLETNADVERLVDKLIEDPEPKIIFFPVAMMDFEIAGIEMKGVGKDGSVWTGEIDAGNNLTRLSTHTDVEFSLRLTPAKKVIPKIRKTRKDIFLVGFKTTTGAEPQEQFEAGLRLLKEASCNLVVTNDIHTEVNMIVTPEQAPYCISTDRYAFLTNLVHMTLSRAKGRFTRSQVMGTDFVPWDSPQIPHSLRKVVDHCIDRGAYKPFQGKTVGHFAMKRDPMTFFTSMRGKDFNQLRDPNSGVGLVQVRIVDDDNVVAYGGKPSVGGQSQRIIFRDHPDMDCIVHFHCPLKNTPVNSAWIGQNDPIISVRPQFAHECGSHECGENTSNGLREYYITSPLSSGSQKIWAVMLDNHGPNIVFHRDTDPQAVINFIETYWDLDRSTSEVGL